MVLTNRKIGFLYILFAYVQFIPIYTFYRQEQNFIAALFLFISALLVFALSARGVIILFTDSKK